MKTAKGTRILGVDYGLRRIGLAWSDENKIIASPLMTLMAEKSSEATALKLVALMQELAIKHNTEIEEILIGYPLLMSGRIGLLADEVTHFTKLLSALISIPVRLWDERLSTVQAERCLRETSLSRKKRSKVVDIVSAAIILQSYLDHKKHRT